MMWSNGMGWGGWLHGAGHWWFWALVVLAVVALFADPRPGDDPHRARTRMQILDERFARGEIDADEYRAPTCCALRTSAPPSLEPAAPPEDTTEHVRRSAAGLLRSAPPSGP